MGVSTYAQSTYTFAADTLMADDTVFFEYPSNITGNYTWSFGVTADEIAGSPTVESKQQVQTQSGKWVDYTADSTLTSAGTPDSYSYILYGDTFPFKKTRMFIRHAGTTTGDTTRVTTDFVYKKR